MNAPAPLAAPPSAYRLRLRDDGRAAPPHQHQAASQQHNNQRDVEPLQAVAVGPLQAVAPRQGLDASLSGGYGQR